MLSTSHYELVIEQLERLSKHGYRSLGLPKAIEDSYEQATAGQRAARLWIDAIIDPAQTREVLITALEACAMNPDVPKFNPGVLQT